jgi:hypothetical protein
MIFSGIIFFKKKTAAHSDSETLLYLFRITSAQVWGHKVDIEHRLGWYEKR